MSARIKYLLLGGLCLYVCVVFSFLCILQQNTELHSNSEVKHSATANLEPFHRSQERYSQTKGLSQPNAKKGKLLNSQTKENSVNYLNTNFRPLFKNHFVYSAYVDDRQITAYIRIVAIGPSGGGKKHTGFLCYFGKLGKRFGKKVVETKLIYYETCESHLMKYSFYIMSCPIPDDVLQHYLTAGQSNITIIESKHSAESAIVLPVLNNKQTIKDDVTFAMCIPPLFGNIHVLRFVEFIELSRILGSEHFTFYDHGVSQDIKTVLQFYEKARIATVLPWKLPVTSIWYNGQSAAIGDCLFRNMYRYNFVAFNDIDEFILPHKGEAWEDMLKFIHLNSTILPEDTAVYRFRSSFFTPMNGRSNLTQFPNTYKLFISQNNTYRTAKVSNVRTKLLVNPTKVFEIGIHHLSKPIDDKFVTLNVDPQVALVHHYRKCDASYDMSCAMFTEDTTAWKYMTSLISHTNQTLKEMQHLHKTFKTSVSDN